MNWNTTQPTADQIKQDILAIIEESKRPMRPASIILKVVDWLPKKRNDGTWMHWMPLSGELVAISKRALAECRKLPEGTDWYPTLEGMKERC